MIALFIFWMIQVLLGQLETWLRFSSLIPLLTIGVLSNLTFSHLIIHFFHGLLFTKIFIDISFGDQWSLYLNLFNLHACIVCDYNVLASLILILYL